MSMSIHKKSEREIRKMIKENKKYKIEKLRESRLKTGYLCDFIREPNSKMELTDIDSSIILTKEYNIYFSGQKLNEYKNIYILK